MRRLLILSSILAATAADPAWAKPQRCFKAKEATAEENVRHGVRLREGAARCDSMGLTAGSNEAWQAINEAVAPQFKAQMDIRTAAFGREFESNAEQQLTHWNGRIVMHFRHRPLTAPYCQNLAANLKELRDKGWPAFIKQAKLEAGEIKMDYKICR